MSRLRAGSRPPLGDDLILAAAGGLASLAVNPAFSARSPGASVRLFVHSSGMR